MVTRTWPLLLAVLLLAGCYRADAATGRPDYQDDPSTGVRCYTQVRGSMIAMSCVKVR